MPKISFVMPTKNRGKLISATIQTIIDQEEKDWELIVVDDHSDSSDNTEEVISSFKDSRIKFFRIPQKWPGGIAAARNFGSQIASSPLIAPADSDDLYLPNRSKLIYETFMTEKWDVFYADYDYYYKDTGEYKPRINPIENFNIELLQKFNFIPHPTSAYRTELAYQFPYNSFFVVAEDYDLFSRLATAGKKFYFCKEKVVHYVIHDSNISGGKDLKPTYDKLVFNNRGWQNLEREKIIKDIIENYGK